MRRSTAVAACAIAAAAVLVISVAACASSTSNASGTRVAAANAPAGTLDIYFIDVEGGKATLVVTPTRESFLLDAGFPGDGTFNSKVGDPSAARDAQRVLAAARDAGVTQIDHLLLSHYHADHFGGVMELAQVLPIREFIDHAAPSPTADENVPGTLALYEAYDALRSAGTHRLAHAGDHYTFRDVTVDVLASDGAVLTRPLPGAGAPNSACTSGGIPAQEVNENPRSTSYIMHFGAFQFLDVGDLSGPPLYALTCPVNLIGRADVYAIAHHGGADGADPSLFQAVRPRVAIFSNGPIKGAQAPTLATLTSLQIPGWQLHRTQNPGAVNVPDAQIANLDQSTSAWIKVSATANGAFTIRNGRTGQTVSYPGGSSK